MNLEKDLRELSRKMNEWAEVARANDVRCVHKYALLLPVAYLVYYSFS